MARDIGFDASYISRIASGQRKPSNGEEFINSICNYIVKSYNSEEDKSNISKLINVEVEEIADTDSFFNKLKNWFFSNQSEIENPTSRFLKKLDEFNLNEYIKLVHFDTLKIPYIPFFHTPNKNYFGIEEMKNGELDFFKSTVFSKTKEPIFMYNEMPMEDMAKDINFGKKWMFAIACCLKKGLKLNIIHNLDRPFNELMLGLESWIPIYMTGQISPYYFKDLKNDLFYHTLYVSGSAALSGDGIKNNHQKSKYLLTNKKNDLEFYKENSKLLLKKASPLMDIYTEADKESFKRFINSEKKSNKNSIFELKNKNLEKTFSNIKFTICKNKWVMISKKNNPEIHFVIYHSKLREAIENFIIPISEK